MDAKALAHQHAPAPVTVPLPDLRRSAVSVAADFGPMDGKRERSKAANREAILAAARTVFARMGYDAASVRDIIRGTDLATGTFYNYFKSKEEVYDALQDDGARRFRPLLRAQCAAANDLEGFVRGAVDAYFNFLENEREAGRMDHVVEAGPAPRRRDTPELRAVFEEVREQIEASTVRDGGSPVKACLVAAAAIGVAREVGDHWLTRGGDRAEASAFCSDFILAAMGRSARG